MPSFISVVQLQDWLRDSFAFLERSQHRNLHPYSFYTISSLFSLACPWQGLGKGCLDTFTSLGHLTMSNVCMFDIFTPFSTKNFAYKILKFKNTILISCFKIWLIKESSRFFK